MDVGLFLRFQAKLIICVSLVFAGPQLVSWMFPVFWVDDPKNLNNAFYFSYLIGCWYFIFKSGSFSSYPEDYGFTEYHIRLPSFLRAIVSSYCWLVGAFVGWSPIIAIAVARP
jgi:hypothetical protein